MYRLLTVIGLCTALSLPVSVSAQNVFQADACGDRGALTRKLAKSFGEIQQAAGVVSADSVLELWRSSEGSWTILMTRADGLTCILAAGDFWHELMPVEGDPA